MAGEPDRWEYAYRVSDVSFDEGFGFSIFFAVGLYTDLESSPAAPNGDWDVLVLPVDISLPADGVYDALALSDGASLLDPFRVRFTYLGQGTPGSQPFELYNPGFATIASGTTQAVPEPGAALLIGAALAGAAVRRSRQRPRAP